MDHSSAMRRLYELINSGDIDGFGDLLAEDFVEHSAAPGLEPSREGVKQLFRTLRDVPRSADGCRGGRFDIDELIAEREIVVARFTGEMRDASGTAIPFRGLTYYRVVDGRIVEDDPFTSPDLAQQLSSLMPAPAA